MRPDKDLKFAYELPSFPHFVSFTVALNHIPDGCYVSSIRYGGRDVPVSGIEFVNDAAMEITIGTDSGQVDGKVLDPDDKPVASAVAVLIPADGKRGPLSVLSGADGAFHLAAVPPGDYKLLAWDDVSPDDFENPEFVKGFDSQAVAVKLPASAGVAVSARVIR